MGRPRESKILSVFRKHPIGVWFLIILGTAIADLQNFREPKGEIFNIDGIAILILHWWYLQIIILLEDFYIFHFFWGLIYFIFKGIWWWYKNLNYVISSSDSTKVNIVAIEELDRMDGRQFELFLSKLYDGLVFFWGDSSSSDFGADVITVKDKTKTVIQTKCLGEG